MSRSRRRFPRWPAPRQVGQRAHAAVLARMRGRRAPSSGLFFLVTRSCKRLRYGLFLVRTCRHIRYGLFPSPGGADISIPASSSPPCPMPSPVLRHSHPCKPRSQPAVPSDRIACRAHKDPRTPPRTEQIHVALTQLVLPPSMLDAANRSGTDAIKYARRSSAHCAARDEAGDVVRLERWSWTDAGKGDV